MSEDLLAQAVWTLHGPHGSCPAAVPTTVAAVLGDRPDLASAVWEWRTRVPARPGPWRLTCAGLATWCEVSLDGAPVASSTSMWQPLVVDLDGVGGDLALRFRPVEPPVGRKPRARWRSSLVADQDLRWVRTTQLGRMAGEPRTPVPVGPWRPVTLTRPGPTVRRLAASLRGTTGVVDLEVDGLTGPATVSAGGRTAPVADGLARIEIPDVGCWWPHTHGPQPLYEVWLEHPGGRNLLGRSGFRTVEVDQTDGGFAVSVNGRGVFVRGACWAPLDPVGLQAPASELREALLAVRTAGLNAVRVVGTDVYERPAFFDFCDELGLLVWQDAMLAGFDYPDDDGWLADLDAELDAVLRPLAHRPSIAVVSGGSETEQRPAMLGLRSERRAPGRSAGMVAAAAARYLPGVPTVSSTPSGSPIAHRVGRGTAHWFGVGGYRRPLVDARLAGVRFAVECLAFGAFPDAGPAPGWVTPRDAGADWDFVDVTAHYVRELYGAERTDDRWPDLARAAVADCMAHVLTEWRRPGSGCGGGLVLSWRDLVPGPGWGLTDAAGRPKSGWYALRRVCAPRAVLLGGEGQDGVAVHVLNDTAEPLVGVLRLRTWAATGQALETADTPVRIAGRSGASYDAEELLGGWRDLTWAYRFGPPSVDVVAATLLVDGVVVSEAVHLPLGHARPRADPGLRWQVETGPDSCVVTVRAERFARGVVVDAAGWTPDDAWLALPPGDTARVTLRPTPAAGVPEVDVRYLDRPAVSDAARTARAPSG